jgi:hypothetical protein
LISRQADLAAAGRGNIEIGRAYQQRAESGFAECARKNSAKRQCVTSMSSASHPGLYIDRFVLTGLDGTQTPAVLLTHPRLADVANTAGWSGG